MAPRTCRCGADLVTLDLGIAELTPPLCPACGDAAKQADEEAWRSRALEEALAAAGATSRLLRQTLASHPDQGARAAAEAWISAYAAGERQNLWLHGPLGTGKTGIAWGIVRHLAEAAVEAFFAQPPEDRDIQPRRPALFLDWAGLLDDLRASFDAQRRIERGGDPDEPDPAILFDRASRVPVLALDDVGRERPTPYAVEKLSVLVNDRYERDLPTILTSNLGTRDLAQQLDHGETVSGQRIVSRLLEGARGHRFEGPSRRRRAA